MKIAICLKGHMRNMAVYNSILLLRQHHTVDVYIQTYSEIGTKSGIQGRMFPKKGTILPNSGTVDVSLVEKLFSPKKLEIENYEDVEPCLDELTEKYFYNWMPRDSVYPNTILSQIRQRALCIDLIDDSYDYVIVTRPDVEFIFKNPNISIEENCVGITVTTKPMYEHADGGIWFDDLVLVGTQSTMKNISSFYYNLETVMNDLQSNNYIGIAKCMHQIQSYAFQKHCNLKLIGCDGLFSNVSF
jgi:hypothetical protein